MRAWILYGNTDTTVARAAGQNIIQCGGRLPRTRGGPSVSIISYIERMHQDRDELRERKNKWDEHEC